MALVVVLDSGKLLPISIVPHLLRSRRVHWYIQDRCKSTIVQRRARPLQAVQMISCCGKVMVEKQHENPPKGSARLMWSYCESLPHPRTREPTAIMTIVLPLLHPMPSDPVSTKNATMNFPPDVEVLAGKYSVPAQKGKARSG
jgi:hypothetical protein